MRGAGGEDAAEYGWKYIIHYGCTFSQSLHVVRNIDNKRKYNMQMNIINVDQRFSGVERFSMN